MIKRYILSVLLSLSLLVACGPKPSPEEVISRTVDAVSELQTYRYQMTSAMILDGEASQAHMQGEFVSPDRLHVTIVNDDRTEEGIRIGQTEYIWQSYTDSWEMRDWSAAMYSLRNNMALSTVEMLDSLVGLVKLPDEKIDGVSCFHYRGSIDVEAQVKDRIANLDPTLPGYEEIVQAMAQQPRSEQNVEFWVGKEDYLLRQIDTQADMVYTDDEGKDTEREVSISATYSLRFYDFNQPIQIEHPTGQ